MSTIELLKQIFTAMMLSFAASLLVAGIVVGLALLIKYIYKKHLRK